MFGNYSAFSNLNNSIDLFHTYLLFSRKHLQEAYARKKYKRKTMIN